MEEDFIRVVRPIKFNTMNTFNTLNTFNTFNDYDIKDLNIIGIFKVHSLLGKTKHDCSKKIDYKTILSEKLDCKRDCVSTKSRNEGFNILSDRNNVSTHLRKTKFCKIKITTGCCTRSVCNFAHNMNEYHFAECAFKINCKKEGCCFKHPNETVDEYKNRINFKIPLNI